METYLLSTERGLGDGLPDENAWKPLGFLNVYRSLLAGVFIGLYLSGHLLPPLGSRQPEVFFLVSLAYLGIGALSALAIQQHRPAFSMQVHLNVLADIAAVALLMHASGGVSSGLGMLMVASLAGGSILMGGRTALFYAATASLTVLAEQFYAYNAGLDAAGAYPQAGMLGITFFATATLSHLLARRIRESEALARQRGVDLANLAQLTEYVIQRMQTGIVVVDDDYGVRLINESAWNMLGRKGHSGVDTLAALSPELAEQLYRSRRHPGRPMPPFRPTPVLGEVQARFAPIGQDGQSGTLVFLEDTAGMAQKAQQLKLASLGRLTASIAHEVRNPLGAVSHAGELLAESPNLDAGDRKLTRIIEEQSRRINGIIENVLRLSRRSGSRPEHFALEDWLAEFLETFDQTHELEPGAIAVRNAAGVELHVDPTHLEQILTNLLENALRHSAAAPPPRVELRSGITEEFQRPFLEVVDRGPGIDEETAQYVFEPFFTTQEKGTGLGLYLARELAEANQAQITYRRDEHGGSCFRITFQDPRKQIN